MVTWVLALGGVAFVGSAGMCAGLLRWSRRAGWTDAVGAEPHKRPMGGREVLTAGVPNVGGVGVFAAVAWPMLAVLGAVWLPPEVWMRVPGLGEVIEPHLAGLRATAGIGGGVLAGLAAVHVMGVVDDRRALGPWLKLGVQAVVAGGLVLFCDIRVLTFLAGDDAAALGGGAHTETAWASVPGVGWAAMFAVSVAWVVVVTNAMNFLDNMDGLAAGVGLVAGGLYLAATLIGGQWFVAALAALLCGALAGFLVFNLPPARLYLGDGGSLVVGLLLAVISVRTTYVAPPEGALAAAGSVSGGAWFGVLMPVLVLAVPLYDFVSVTLIRVSRGQSPLRGDHNHFSHRLRRRGLSVRATLGVILLATVATGLGGVMLGRLEGWQAGLVAGQSAAVLGVLALLEWGGREKQG